MLDTLQDVLERDVRIPSELAEAARDVAQDAGSVSLPPLLVMGGGVLAMTDAEDLGVLETALAAGADMLVTGNMRDFTPRPRADIDADIIRSRGGVADVLLVRNSKVPNGLVVTTPYAAKAWLIEGHAPPRGILDRFVPRIDAAPRDEDTQNAPDL